MQYKFLGNTVNLNKDGTYPDYLDDLLNGPSEHGHHEIAFAQGPIERVLINTAYSSMGEGKFGNVYNIIFRAKPSADELATAGCAQTQAPGREGNYFVCPNQRQSFVDYLAKISGDFSWFAQYKELLGINGKALVEPTLSASTSPKF